MEEFPDSPAVPDKVTATRMTAVHPAHFDPDQFAENFFARVAKTHRSVRDVFFLNTVFMWQKGRQNQIKFNSTPNGEDLIAYLKKIYEIREDGDVFLQDDCVTLERIHFAFPTVGCKAAAVGAEQRKASSQLNKVMAIIECPAFARFCSSLAELDDHEGFLFVDAFCWGQYLHERKANPEIETSLNMIRERAMEWKPSFSFEDLAEIFEQKLSMIRDVDDIVLDEANVELGIAELHRTLRSAACLPNVNFIVDQAIYERPFVFERHGEANETFLNDYEVLYFSGALLCYLTTIKKRLCRANRVSHKWFSAKENLPELFGVLKEAAIAVLKSNPKEIIELMRIAGLRVCWGSLMYAAHERVRPIIRNLFLVDVPESMTRLNMAKVGIEMTFTESNLFRGYYPNLISEWASNWRRVNVDMEC